MLTKPLSHLRPLLRLPTHTQPDHFTANPSLLHHLPPNGAHGGHAIVQAGQSSAQAAGQAAGGAGRAGYSGAGAGPGGSGYTGHARAFLSLQQSSAVDPASGLGSDDGKDVERERDRRRLLQPPLTAHVRYGKPPRTHQSTVQLADLEEFSTLHENDTARLTFEGAIAKELQAIKAGSGSGEETRRLTAGTEIDESPASGTPRGNRRSSVSIPFPRPARGLALSRQSSNNHSVASSRPSLSRTSSTVDVWAMGAITSPASPRPTFVRAASTVVPEKNDSAVQDEQVVPVPVQSVPTSRFIPQPNRVLMDLAGMDLPMRITPTQRRFNSTSAQTSTSTSVRSWTDDVVPSLPSRPLSSVQVEDEERNTKLYDALLGSTRWGQKSHFMLLVKHYRSSRTLAPFDERSQPGEPEVSGKYPLPSDYSVKVYNQILTGLTMLRNPGESIAPVLEVYNEMLEREILPNGRTYATVIEALCLRQKDIWQAVQFWQKEKSWLDFRREKLDIRYIHSVIRDRQALVDGYLAEGNLVSALRLFRAATTFQVTSKWRFPPHIYHSLLDAISSSTEPDTVALNEVLRHAEQRNVGGALGLNKFAFRAYGNTKNTAQLERRYEDFVAADVNGKDNLGDWMAMRDDDGLLSDQEPRLRGIRRDCYVAAMQAFIKVGNFEKASEVLETTVETSKVRIPDVGGDIWATDSEVYGLYLAYLAQEGHADRAIQEHQRLAPAIAETALHELRQIELQLLTDEYTMQLKWEEALRLLEIQEKNSGFNNSSLANAKRYKKIITSLLADARSTESPERARDLLERIPGVMGRISFKMKPDVSLTKVYLGIVRQHGLYDLVEGFMRSFETIEQSIPVEAITHTFNEAVSRLPVKDVLSLIDSLPSGHVSVADSGILLERYSAERSTMSSPTAQELVSAFTMPGYVELVKSAARLDEEALKEDARDQALEMLVGDLEIIQQSDLEPEFNALKDAKLRTALGKFAAALAERFGSERMFDMMRPAVKGGEKFAMAGWKLVVSRSKGSHPIELPSAVVLDQSADTEQVASTSDVASPPSLSEGQTASTNGDAPNTPAQSVLETESAEPSEKTTHRRLRYDNALSEKIDGMYNQYAPRPDADTHRMAHAVFMEAFEKGDVPGIHTVARLINQCGRAGDEERAGQLYTIANNDILPTLRGLTEKRIQSWVAIENAMLMACCHLGRLEQAGAHRARIVESGRVPSADAYATMIASSKDTTDDAMVARELFDESRALGVQPNLYLYNTIISKLSKARKVETVLELFAHMKARRVHPSSVTYGAVINACCRVGDVQSAENLFEEMTEQRNFRPRVPPFNTMMQLFVQTVPDRNKSLHYFNLLLQYKVKPTAHTYKLLLDTYATLPPLDLAGMDRVFADLEAEKYVKVNGAHYASLITGRGIYGADLASAIVTFESIPQVSETSTILQEAVVWEAILNVIAHRGSLEQLEDYRRRMDAMGVRASAYVYNVLILGYSRGGALDVARELFESMGDSIAGVAAPNNHPALHTSAGYLKPSTVTDVTDVVYREPSTYEAMIRAELAAGEIGRAQELFARMEARGYPYAVVMRIKATLDEGMAVAGQQVGA